MVLVLYCVAPVNAMKEGEDWVQGGGRKMRGGGERREGRGEHCCMAGAGARPLCVLCALCTVDMADSVSAEHMTMEPSLSAREC